MAASRARIAADRVTDATGTVSTALTGRIGNKLQRQASKINFSTNSVATRHPYPAPAKVRLTVSGFTGVARLAVWTLLAASLLLSGCARKLNQWTDGKYYSAREIAVKKREARRLAHGLPAAARPAATARASRRAARRASRYAGTNAPTDAAASLIRTARTYVGTPYRAGGTTRLGMDCSGLLSTTFQEAGFEIPRSSREQSTFGDDLAARELRPGDLIFFATDGGASRRISHVGLVTEAPDPAASDVLFIHSSSSLGVKEDNLQVPYWQRAYVKAVRPRLVPRASADAGGKR